MLKGAGNSIGIGIGHALVLHEQEQVIEKRIVTDAKEEIRRLEAAVERAKAQIEVLLDKAYEELGEEHALIFETHLAYLEDPGYFGKIYERIEKESVSAEWAIKVETEQLQQTLATYGGDLIAERGDDLKDVSARVLNALLNIEEEQTSLNGDEKIVLIADNLLPSQLMQQDLSKVVGIVTVIGGTTAHVAIIAKSKGIPAVMGVKGLLNSVKNKDTVVVDAKRGEVYINPDEKLVQSYQEEMKADLEIAKELRTYAVKDAILSDGRKILVEANIGYPQEAAAAMENGADGIGLFRSEFLYFERKTEPSEQEQFLAYKAAAEKMQGKPLVIRTMDIGGDKEVPYLDLPKECNPFLGFRAIRVCLQRRDLFTKQLRAILKASAFGNIKIMIPMITCLDELMTAKQIIEEQKQKLREENIAFDENIEVGIMIETPAAVMISDKLAQNCDFFSIGTNDLIQYTIAVDRINEQVSYLYSAYHPSVLREIGLTVKNAKQAGITVAVCGESASDPYLIPVLLGLGVDALSVNSVSIGAVKKIICTGNAEEFKALAEKALDAGCRYDVEELIKGN